MDKHNQAQESHYEQQYSHSKVELSYEESSDLWEWAKWFPLLELEGFLKTIRGRRLVAICCGSGRELGLFHKYGIKTTATDLTINHLETLIEDRIIESAEIQNAERLSYKEDDYDYGFVNAGLHHLAHPHAGLNELMRVGREAAIFIESQDSILHSLGKMMGRNADFEPAGNYVYRWSRREVEKIALSSHAYSYAIRTNFLPVLVRMRGVTGEKKRKWQRRLNVLDGFLGWAGNLMVVIIFKRKPNDEQIKYFKDNNYYYKDLTEKYPAHIKLRT